MQINRRGIFVFRSLMVLVLIAGSLGSFSVTAQAAVTDLYINEIRIDQPGSDVDEYLEIAGPANEPLDDVTYLVIGDGDPAVGSGVLEAVINLDGFTLNSSGFLLVTESSFTLGSSDYFTNVPFENSDNVTHLLVQGYSSIYTLGDDLDTDDDGVLDRTPWTMIIDQVALIKQDNPPLSTEYHYGPPTVGPDGVYVPGHVIRCYDGWRIGSFDPAAGDDTPRAANPCPALPPATSTSLTSSLNPSEFGDSVTFEAQVIPSETTTLVPGGTITFMAEDSTLGEVTLDAGGQAVINTDALVVGTQMIYAIYSGDAEFRTSTGQLIQTVNEAVVLTPPDVAISEIRIDQSGGDDDEYFELAGEPGTVLDGATYLVIGDGAGDSGTIEAVVNLSGSVVPASGYFVAAEGTYTLGTADLTSSINFENSDNLTHLVVFEFSGANGDDLDTDDDGVLDVTPWTQLIDIVAMIEEENPPAGTEYHYGPPVVGPDGSYVPGHVYTCEEGWRIGEFSLGVDDTPGAANTCTPLMAASQTALTSTLNPSLLGESVTFDAQVTPVVPDGLTPTGSLTFLDGTTELGTVALDAEGNGSLTTDALALGDHTITAQYSGDAAFNPSSTELVQTVNEEIVVLPPEVSISEVRVDQSGADNDEYFELFAEAGTILDGVTYLVIGDGAGGSGTIEAAIDLSGAVIPASGYFVAAESTYTLGVADLTASINFENSDNQTHLLVFEFSGANGDDLDTDDDGVLDVMPWTSLIDLIALVEEDNPPAATEFHYGPPSVGPDGTYMPGHVYTCEEGWRVGAFALGEDDTPGAANFCAVELPEIYINELDADTPGTDLLEFIELFDGGSGGTALDGLVLVLYNGSNDLVYQSFDLDGYATDAQGYFVLGSVAGADYTVSGTSWLQNGADAAALYLGSAEDFLPNAALTTENLIDALVYDTDDNYDTGLSVLLNPGQPQVNEAGEGNKDQHSSQRCPNGSGGLLNTDTFAQFLPTPGEENICELVVIEEQCGDPFTTIYQIQGSDMESSLISQMVSVEGLVSGDFQADGQLSGFFLQDIIGDGLLETSDGLFVFAPGALDVNPGDHLRISGVVTEFYGMTQISSLNNLLICGSGNSVEPLVLDLPMLTEEDLEKYEGMLVTFPEELTVSEAYDLGRYGEMTVSAEGRLFNPTNDQGGSQEQNDLRRLLVDDGSTVSNPLPAPYLGADNTLRLGDTISGLTGNLNYSFGKYKLQPTIPPAILRQNERPEAPDVVGGVIRVASFNVLNYFTTIDDGSNQARGADSLEEFTRQQYKLISAILILDADVVGLMELENNGDAAVNDLVAQLNLASGAETYAVVPLPADGLGDDAIRVGLIYKPAVVSLLGASFSDTDPVYSRPPMAQTFSAYDEVFTVVVNHFKSKGCSNAAGLDEDQGDGQGCYNYTRTQQALQILTFVEQLKVSSGDENVLVIGDLNAYGLEDPISALTDGGLLNQVAAWVPLEERYSYVYYGQAGYLDHALSTPAMDSLITDVDIWHINADEPRILDYNTEYNPPELYQPDAYRSSDHDPVVIGMCEGVAPQVEVSLSHSQLWPANRKLIRVSAEVNVVDNYDQNPTATLLSVTSDEPDSGLYGGDKPNDIRILDDYSFKLRAERYYAGDGRVYTITYLVTDSCGNETIVSETVLVPRYGHYHHYLKYFYKWIEYLLGHCKSNIPLY